MDSENEMTSLEDIANAVSLTAQAENSLETGNSGTADNSSNDFSKQVEKSELKKSDDITYESFSNQLMVNLTGEKRSLTSVEVLRLLGDIAQSSMKISEVECKSNNDGCKRLSPVNCEPGSKRSRNDEFEAGQIRKKVKKKIQNLSRKEITDLVAENIVELLASRSELGKLRRKCDECVATADKWKRKTQLLKKMCRDLSLVMENYISDIIREKDHLVPVRIARSVALQVTKNPKRIDQTIGWTKKVSGSSKADASRPASFMSKQKETKVFTIWDEDDDSKASSVQDLTKNDNDNTTNINTTDMTNSKGSNKSDITLLNSSKSINLVFNENNNISKPVNENVVIIEPTNLIDNSSGIVSLSTTSTTAGIVSLSTSTKAGIVIFSPSTSAQTLTSTTTTTVQPLTPVARRFTYIALRPTPNILTPTNLTQGFPTTTATMSNSLPTTSPMLYNGFTPMSSALQHFRAQIMPPAQVQRPQTRPPPPSLSEFLSNSRQITVPLRKHMIRQPLPIHPMQAKLLPRQPNFLPSLAQQLAQIRPASLQAFNDADNNLSTIKPKVAPSPAVMIKPIFATDKSKDIYESEAIDESEDIDVESVTTFTPKALQKLSEGAAQSTTNRPVIELELSTNHDGSARTSEKLYQCPECELQIRASLIRRHIVAKHPAIRVTSLEIVGDTPEKALASVNTTPVPDIGVEPGETKEVIRKHSLPSAPPNSFPISEACILCAVPGCNKYTHHSNLARHWRRWHPDLNKADFVMKRSSYSKPSTISPANSPIKVAKTAINNHRTPSRAQVSTGVSSFSLSMDNGLYACKACGCDYKTQHNSNTWRHCRKYNHFLDTGISSENCHTAMVQYPEKLVVDVGGASTEMSKEDASTGKNVTEKCPKYVPK